MYHDIFCPMVFTILALYCCCCFHDCSSPLHVCFVKHCVLQAKVLGGEILLKMPAYVLHLLANKLISYIVEG